MTRLRKMMLEELERRNYSESTTRRYLRFVERFAQHFGKSPDKLGPDHLRTYQAYLLKVKCGFRSMWAVIPLACGHLKRCDVGSDSVAMWAAFIDLA